MSSNVKGSVFWKSAFWRELASGPWPNYVAESTVMTWVWGLGLLIYICLFQIGIYIFQDWNWPAISWEKCCSAKKFSLVCCVAWTPPPLARRPAKQWTADYWSFSLFVVESFGFLLLLFCVFAVICLYCFFLNQGRSVAQKRLSYFWFCENMRMRIQSFEHFSGRVRSVCVWRNSHLTQLSLQVRHLLVQVHKFKIYMDPENQLQNREVWSIQVRYVQNQLICRVVWNYLDPWRVFVCFR